jgi:excisionase family DNA binding protein
MSKANIVTVNEAAKILGVDKRTIYRKIETGTIPKHTMFRGYKELIGVNLDDLRKNTKSVPNTVVDFNLTEAIDGVVEVVHSTGEKVIEVLTLDSDIRNNVVYVKESGIVEVCNEDGYFGDQQVLFIKGKKQWANVYRDEWNDYIVYEDRYSTEEEAIKEGTKLAKSNEWHLASTILLAEAVYFE